MANNVDRAIELTNRVISLRSQLASAEAELHNFIAGKAAKPATRTPPKRGPIRGSNAPSVSQRVLAMITNSGRQGIASRDIVAVIPNKEAVHSALQAHRTAGRIVNDGGQWCITAAYGEELSAPIAIPQVETKPLRHPAGGEYLGQ